MADLVHSTNGAAMQPRQSQPLQFSDEQRQIIRDTLANGASEQEFAPLMEMAKARGLNPLTQQIWFVKRWDSAKSREVWACQVSIDGLRAQAERTGLYAGQDEPEFEYEKDGRLKLAKVKVYRKDWERPAVGVARWSEFAALKKDGTPTHMWANKSHIMLAKVAEAQALRKAFPQDTSGLYTAEEMEASSGPAVRVEAGEVESRTEAHAAKSVDLTAELIARINDAQTPLELEAIGAEIKKQPASIKAALRVAYQEKKSYLADAPPPDLGSPRDPGEEG